MKCTEVANAYSVNLSREKKETWLAMEKWLCFLTFFSFFSFSPFRSFFLSMRFSFHNFYFFIVLHPSNCTDLGGFLCGGGVGRRMGVRRRLVAPVVTGGEHNWAVSAN